MPAPNPILLAIIILLAFMYYQYAFGYVGSRVWPIPNIQEFKETMLFQADVIMDKSKQFIIGKPNDPNVPSVRNDEQTKQEAIQFFKTQYGLSDLYLSVVLRKVYVNDKTGYNASLFGKTGATKLSIIDGGYLVYLPPGKRLYGKYGGKWGVTVRKSSIIPYGYYKFGDYLLRYFAVCPMAWTSTYDGEYTIIDCDVEVIESPQNRLNGFKGKAQGMQKKFNLVNGKHHIVIRNVITLSDDEQDIREA